MNCIVRGVLLAAVLSPVSCDISLAQKVHGDLRQWHRVVIDFQGPATSESAEPNPFTDYRLNVTVSSPDGQTYVVPGYYAADGDAANSSGKSGSTWRVCFTPDTVGRWGFAASFRTGRNIAVNPEHSAGMGTAFDGAAGGFDVAISDKQAPDLRAQGLLQYVSEHYLRFAGTGEYFLKGGADSPENFLAYAEFDDSYDADAGSGSYEEVGTFIHKYVPHVKDWRRGDPTWQDGKGKGIIGMLNYLASKGMNSVYFLTYNLDGGDGRDTWMWTGPEVRDRFDCSKLDQWEVVFRHMDRLGIMLHVVTQETENDHKLGGGAGLSFERRLYYRELVARFGHHPAVIWNLGEENNTPDADRKKIAQYVRGLDVYRHPITVHTHVDKALTFYDGILGDPSFEATSNQSAMDRYNNEAIILRQRSAKAGRKWAIFGDEQSPASAGVVPDEDDPQHDAPRKQGLWGNLMGGGSGVEWYFGHQFAHMDINCEDWRSRDRMWDQTRYALEFFHRYLPFAQMQPDNELTSDRESYCLAQPSEVYCAYLPDGGSTNLNVGAGTYLIRWYNPRAGGTLQQGSIERMEGPGWQAVGTLQVTPTRIGPCSYALRRFLPIASVELATTGPWVATNFFR